MVSVGEADFLESHSFYEDLLGLNTHRTIPAPVSCVVVAIARNCASTSNVFCRNIDNSGSGEGEPFQLRKLENRSFWKNEEVTNEGIKLGCLLEYRVVTCRQSFLGRYCDLGEQDGKQFIFHKRTSKLQDVDKILLDLQDDESVHEGLKEALEYYNRKDLDKILLDLTNCSIAHDKHLKEALKCFNPEHVHTIQLDFMNLTFAHFERLMEAFRCVIPTDVMTTLDVIHLINGAIKQLTEDALKCFNSKFLDRMLPEFTHLILVHCEHLKEALKGLNLKFPRLQAYSACTRLFFTGIRAGTINNERVTLETMSGERLDMPLNCRESLVLSTGPVHLQLERPWGVADNNVGGVAVVKYEDGKTTCEGLILRYKPYVISRDEEPVKIQNASGEMSPIHHVFGLESGKMRWKVLFDTGNEVGTGISRELLEELDLLPDDKEEVVELIGGGSDTYKTRELKLFIRGCHFRAHGLVGAVAEDTNLLMGTDVIEQLYDRGYTIGR